MRVSNELGAGRPKAAKFSILVVVMMSVVIQTTFALIIFLTRKDFPAVFTENKLVMEKVTKLVPFLCSGILLCSVQPVLSGEFVEFKQGRFDQSLLGRILIASCRM